MKQKWLNYYREIPLIYAIVLCFDPRCKFENLFIYYSNYYQCLGITDVDPVVLANNIKTLFYELYDEYLILYGPSMNITVQTSENVSSSKSRESFSSFMKLGFMLMSKQTKKGRTSSSSSTAEVDVYLKTQFEFMDSDNIEFNILEWWKEHEKHFPILSIIAKQILGTPVSTVAVEQEFSSDGNILDLKRSLMSPESAQVEVYVHDWTKAQLRQQEMDEVKA